MGRAEAASRAKFSPAPSFQMPFLTYLMAMSHTRVIVASHAQVHCDSEQAALPCMLMAGHGSPATRSAPSADGAQQPAESVRSVLRLRGGTDASMAPPVGYAQHVLLPLLRSKLRIDVTLDVVRRGFYPKARQSACLSPCASCT